MRWPVAPGIRGPGPELDGSRTGIARSAHGRPSRRLSGGPAGNAGRDRELGCHLAAERPHGGGAGGADHHRRAYWPGQPPHFPGALLRHVGPGRAPPDARVLPPDRHRAKQQPAVACRQPSIMEAAAAPATAGPVYARRQPEKTACPPNPCPTRLRRARRQASPRAPARRFATLGPAHPAPAPRGFAAPVAGSPGVEGGEEQACENWLN